MMSKDAQIRQSLASDQRAYRQVHAAALKLVEGRRVRVTSNFNGQPHGGRSRKALTGKILIIDSVHFYEGSDTVSFCGHTEDGGWINAGFTLNDIEFLEE